MRNMRSPRRKQPRDIRAIIHIGSLPRFGFLISSHHLYRIPQQPLSFIFDTLATTDNDHTPYDHTMFSRSSSTSTLSDNAKRHLLTCLPTDSKVLATATAKVYHAPFNTKTDGAGWTFSGMSGTLVFGRARTILHADRPLGESIQHEHWFRLVDPIKGLVWIHQIPDTLDYAPDKPFFHVFAGKVRRAPVLLASSRTGC